MRWVDGDKGKEEGGEFEACRKEFDGYRYLPLDGYR